MEVVFCRLEPALALTRQVKVPVPGVGGLRRGALGEEQEGRRAVEREDA